MIKFRKIKFKFIINSFKNFLIFSSIIFYTASVNSENINNIKNILKVEFFGNYIPKEAKINSSLGSFYFLPSDLFQRNHKSKNNQVYFINHMAFGNLNNDGITDLILSYEMEVCPGKLKLSSVGVPLCEVEEGGTNYLNFAVFTVTEQSRKQINKRFKQITNLGRNCQRPILADFNSDGIDDVYCPSAYGHQFNGKFYYGGADAVFISNQNGEWVQTKEIGEMVDDKTGLYQGFSHGVTVNDIDHDGDLDIITPHIKWEKTKGGGKIYCHLNDGQGNFSVKHCADQFAFAVTTGDYNGDGIVDLIASGGWFEKKLYSHSSSKKHNNTVVLFGDGKGNFKKGWKKIPPAYDIYGSEYLFSHVVDLVSWDFDGDGDLDISGTTVGPLYAGGTHTIWSNDGNGNFTIADQIPMIPGKKEWASIKAWKNEIRSESNPYNSYCGHTILIDINDDNLMDMYCDSPTQDKHSGWIFLNKGELIFEKISPYKAWKKGWTNYYIDISGGPEEEFIGYSDKDFFETHWYYKSNFN